MSTQTPGTPITYNSIQHVATHYVARQLDYAGLNADSYDMLQIAATITEPSPTPDNKLQVNIREEFRGENNPSFLEVAKATYDVEGALASIVHALNAAIEPSAVSYLAVSVMNRWYDKVAALAPNIDATFDQKTAYIMECWADFAADIESLIEECDIEGKIKNEAHSDNIYMVEEYDEATRNMTGEDGIDWADYEGDPIGYMQAVIEAYYRESVIDSMMAKTCEIADSEEYWRP